MLLRQLSGIAFEQDPAVRQKQYPVAGILDLIHVVGGPENAAAALSGERADTLADQHRGQVRASVAEALKRRLRSVV